MCIIKHDIAISQTIQALVSRYLQTHDPAKGHEHGMEFSFLHIRRNAIQVYLIGVIIIIHFIIQFLIVNENAILMWTYVDVAESFINIFEF